MLKQRMISDDDFSDSDDDDNENNVEIERWVNIDDSELNRLLNVNVSVVIEPHPITINHGSNTFDIETTLDSLLGIT
ncbi:unnamed protein product [Rhizophagus irregularis]|nr:unnamed protein product [Rhizophagus irregularis]CAB4439584.1 unnamed protein product [Rhizophagus irregularis]